MGVPVIVYGKSGCGKSYSLKNFQKDEIVFFNTVNKPLPFRGKFDITAHIMEAKKLTEKIVKASDAGHKRIVVDDAGYIMTNLYMSGHRNKSASSVFDLFNDIGDAIYNMFSAVINSIPADCVVYFIFHEMKGDTGDVKIRTIGKLLDEKVCLEGMSILVIHAVVEDGEHIFRVQANDVDIAKSPEGMFDKDEIPNDLKAVDESIRAYYEFDGNAET